MKLNNQANNQLVTIDRNHLISARKWCCIEKQNHSDSQNICCFLLHQIDAQDKYWSALIIASKHDWNQTTSKASSTMTTETTIIIYENGWI